MARLSSKKEVQHMAPLSSRWPLSALMCCLLPFMIAPLPNAFAQPPKKPPKAPPVGELRRFQAHTTPVLCVAFSPDGRRALSGGGRYANGKPYGCAIFLW